MELQGLQMQICRFVFGGDTRDDDLAAHSSGPEGLYDRSRVSYGFKSDVHTFAGDLLDFCDRILPAVTNEMGCAEFPGQLLFACFNIDGDDRIGMP